MSIRRQMLLVLGLATVLPLVAAVWVGFTYSRIRLHQRANQTLAGSARQIAAGIDGFVRNAVDDVRRNSLLPTFADYLTRPAERRSDLEAIVNRLLRGGVASDPIYVTACGLLDPDGRVVADIDAQRLGRSERDTPWFREALRTRLPYHSTVFEPTEAPGFWLSSPVRDSQDRIVGVLRLGYAPSVFKQLLESGVAATDDDVIPVLLDSAYRSLVSTDPQLMQPPLNADRSPEFVFPHDARMPGTWVRWTAPARSTGQPDRLSVIRLTELPWVVACVQEGASFTAAIREIWRAALLYTTLFVGLMIVGAHLLAHRLSKPIRQLADTAQRVALGDLSATVPVSGGGEVEQTARAFNHMTTRLQESLSTLERQAAEARGSERRLRELIDVSPLGIAVTNTQGEFAQMNRKFVELFGYGADELRTVDDWWPRAFPDPAYRAEVQQGWGSARLVAEKRGVESQPFEATVTCKDGTRRIIEFRSKNVGDVLIVVCLDLTERRRAEAALQTSEERYRLLLEHAPEAVVVFEVESGRFVDCNPAASRLFGYTRAELLHYGPVDLSPALQNGGRPSAEDIGIHVENALAGGRPVFEWTHCSRDGHEFPCEVRLLRLPDAAGRRLVRGSILDISARKHAEDTLRASEERYRLLIENSTELVAQIDPNGNYIYVSPNHRMVTGYHPEEMIGTCVFDYIHADDVAAVLNAFKEPAVEVVRQFRFRFQDGSWHWLESSARRYLTSSGAEMGAVISRDITERIRGEETRKRLESQLRQSQKMEAIGTLAGGIAHDFNNVLTGILCNTQLAEFDLPPDHPARAHINGVAQASLRARDLVAKILTFSRRTEQQFGIHSLPPVVDEALDLLRASLPATIQIRRSLDPGLPPVRCDPGQLHQVVMNLGTNAAHAMAPRGGQITVSLETARPDVTVTTDHPALAGRECVRLQISDTGHGIDPVTRERIFEPFFTTKPVGEGTGLGLSVVHGIIEDHGGAITVDSAPGRGTTFTMWLPVATAPASGPIGSRARPSHPMGRGERILIVDDEPAVAQAGARILDRLGYRTTAFTHGADALDAFRRDPSGYAAVISDLTMPDITGADVVREVFALRPHLPVLITTGYMRSQDVEHIRALGVRTFLQKPFTMETLADSVRKTLDRQ